jgi:hypothetical protein
VLVHNESVCDETIAELRDYYAAGFSKDEIRDWLRSQTKDGKRKYEDADIDKAMDKILAPVEGLPIQFGKDANQVHHTFRHIEGIVDKTKAIAAIADDLNAAAGSLTAGLNIRKVIVDGVELTYNAFKLPDGVINVGRITIP